MRSNGKAVGVDKVIKEADDFIIMTEHENEAQAVYEVLKERLAKFGLELAEDKIYGDEVE